MTDTAPTYRVLNPATGTVTHTYPTATDTEIGDAIDRAHAAYLRGMALSSSDRTEPLRRAAALLRERGNELAQIIAEEMGKSLEQGLGEIEFSATIFDYYADNTAVLTADQHITTLNASAVIERKPLGVLLGIMPWNYPYYQVARFAAPNLAIGNTILLKPSESCPRSALALQTLLADAGVAPHAFQVVFASHDHTETILRSPHMQGVSLTGSERAGAAVAAIAGANLKKVVLELGGSDAYVILDTDSISDAADTAWGMRMENLGQACNSNKRIIVASDLYDSFVDELTIRARQLTPGDQFALGSTQYGPLASRAAAENLHAQVADAVAHGATLHAGGQLSDGPGAYFSPAVLTGVTPEMRAYREELFGPVAVVYRADNDEEALRLANDTNFGLGAAVFSSDIDRARAFAGQLQTGMVAINAPAAEGAELPFGGVKRSGFGRELGSLGLDEFVNKRLVYTA